MPIQTPEKRKLFASTLREITRRVLVGILGTSEKQHISAQAIRSALTVSLTPAIFGLRHIAARLLRSGARRTPSVRIAAVCLVLVVMVTGLGVLQTGKSAAATNGTVNFQARLMSGTG